MLKSNLLSQVGGVLHGFGEIQEPLPSLNESFPLFWKKTRPDWKQVHHRDIAKVLRPRQDVGEVDALVTPIPQLPIGVVTADCVPILLADRSSKQVMAIHSGWRGTIKNIVGTALSQHPGDWVAAIGPHIGPCCYQVSADLVEDFQTTFPSIPHAEMFSGNRHLNLSRIVTESLAAQGVSAIECLDICTYCSQKNDAKRFFSYRRDADSSRQWNIIMST